MRIENFGNLSKGCRVLLKIICFGHSYYISINRSIERYLVETDRLKCVCVGPSVWPGDLRPIRFENESQSSKLKTVAVGTSLSKSIHLFSYSRKTVNHLLSDSWDLAYLWQEPYCRATLLLARSLRKRKIPYVFFTAQNISKRYPWPFSSWEQEVVNHASGWIACGNTVWDTQIRRGYPAALGKVLPHAVDATKFKPFDTVAKAAFKKAIGGIEGPVIGYVGRLTEQKGIRILLAALEKIPANLWGSLVLFGSGPEEDFIKNWAIKHGFTKKIIIRLLQHEEMPLMLGGLDIMVAPSQSTPRWREQFGRMLIEAMASGVPIITSDSGEIPYTVGDAGFVVAEDDISGFAEGIIQLVGSENKCRALIQSGLRRVNNFSVANVSQKYADFWITAAQRKI